MTKASPSLKKPVPCPQDVSPPAPSMAKGKHVAPEEAQRPTSIDSILDVQLKKHEAVLSRTKEIREECRRLTSEIEEMRDDVTKRVAQRGIELKIDSLLEEKAAVAAKEADLTEHLYYVAKVMKERANEEKESKTDRAYDTDEEIEINRAAEEDTEKAKKKEKEVTVDLKASLRRRVEKKKRKLEDISDKSVVKMVSIDIYMKKKAKNDEQDDVKLMLDMMNRRPVEKVKELEVCPKCPGDVLLEEKEKPPSKTCFQCGFMIDLWDTSEVDTGFMVGYRSKQHFMAQVNRVRVKVKHKIPEEVYDVIYTELDNRRVVDVSQVTVNMIDEILRKLSRKVDRKYTNYYQHVYQITNKIRGAPIIVLTEEHVAQMESLFDMTHETWQLIKPSSRLNFLANSFVMRMFFGILGFPMPIVNMLSIIKGHDNIRTYNATCKQICDIQRWPYIPVSEILDNRRTAGHDVKALVGGKSKNTEPDHFSPGSSLPHLKPKLSKFPSWAAPSQTRFS